MEAITEQHCPANQRECKQKSLSNRLLKFGHGNYLSDVLNGTESLQTIYGCPGKAPFFIDRSSSNIRANKLRNLY